MKTARAKEGEKEERGEREEEQSRKKDMRSIDCHRKRGGMQGLLKRQGRFSTQDHGKDLWHAPPSAAAEDLLLLCFCSLLLFLRMCFCSFLIFFVSLPLPSEHSSSASTSSENSGQSQNDNNS